MPKGESKRVCPLSMIASVTNQGKARWMIVDGNLNHQKAD